MATDLIEIFGDGGFITEEELMMDDTQPISEDFAPGVSREDLPVVLKTLIDEAVNYAEEELAGQRTVEQQYYDGEVMPGDENLDASRSKFISRDVHDTVHAILPSLLRIFFSGKSVVCYEPIGPEDEGAARQATEYINEVVLKQDNDGFSIFYDAFHDALLKQVGTVTWFWSPEYEVQGETYRGITEEQYYAIVMDQNVTGLNVLQEYTDVLGNQLYDCEITYKFEKGGKICIEAVPPEERLINKSARTIDDATLYGRRRNLKVSEGVKMGYDYDQLVRLGGTEELDTNEEAVERYDHQTFDEEMDSIDPSMRRFEYKDVYVRVDLDRDGYAELYRIACGGSHHEILRYADTGEDAIQLVSDIPAAEFTPDPVPHRATGRSISRKVMDLQRANTNLIRAMFDSLSRSIFPDQEVVASQVNVDDLFNPEIGKIIRAKAPGMIREVTTTFMGKEALPVLGYMNSVKTNRTGITDTTQGLDASSLQSMGAGAVHAITSASQIQIETVARLFALKGMKRLLRGLLKMTKAKQDRVRTVRLRNEWVEVDPTFWNANMDVTVNTALGRGSEMEKIAVLQQIAERQEQALQMLGPQNPLCTLAEYRNTLAEMVNLSGFPNEDRFFLPVSQQQVMQQMMQERQQIMEQMQQAQQQLQLMAYELQSHDAAEDGLKNAKALKERAETLTEIIEAMQLAAGQNVSPNAANDELAAGGQFLQ